MLNFDSKYSVCVCACMYGREGGAGYCNEFVSMCKFVSFVPKRVDVRWLKRYDFERHKNQYNKRGRSREKQRSPLECVSALALYHVRGAQLFKGGCTVFLLVLVQV